MSHKELLLEGAKQCLSTKGYARTTSRDIVDASRTNLASIRYHYGSKESLLTVAIIELLSEWTERVTAALSSEHGAAVSLDRFEESFNRLIGSFDQVRSLIAVNFEVIAQLDRLPQIRDQLAKAYADARRALAALVLQLPVERVTQEQARTIGGFTLALIPGLMSQYLVSPDQTPDGADLAAAIRSLAPG